MCHFMFVGKKHSVPFSAEEAANSGISRRELNKRLRAGTLERIARGWYRVPVGEYSDDQIFQSVIMRVGRPSAICLISALAYYHLTDTIPRKTWVMVPADRRTKSKDIRLLRKRDPKWSIGIKKISTFQITSIERTLVDALTHRSIIGSQIGIEALRQAIRNKKTTLGKVADMAVKLSVWHRVKPFVEILS